MDYILNDASAESLPRPWFLKTESVSKLQPIQETEKVRITTLFQEYYY